MTKTLLLTTTILAALAFAAAPAAAQWGGTQAVTIDEPPPSPGMVTTAPQAYPPPPAYLEYELAEAKERSRRTRVALIATSVVFGVGLVLAGAGASQCEVITRVDRNDEYVCNDAGDVLVPLGASLSVAGAIGMITSGAMLGVRNRTKREIERDLRRRYYGRGLQWDTRSGRFVF